MSRSLPIIPADNARRLLMGAQGLLADPSRRADRGSLRRLIDRMGFVQLDSINVAERAHHLTLHSRLDDYRPELLAHLLEKDRHLFEHWTHDASAIPVKWYPHWKPRFERSRVRIRRNKWWQARVGKDADQIIAHVLERIERDGPLQSRDFEHETGQTGSWWGWKPQKAALEYLWHTGELAVAKRINFQKVYDLPQRVLGEHHAQPAPSAKAHLDWACRTAMERLVIATPSELAAYWQAVHSRDVQRWCRQAHARGEIEPVILESTNGSKPRRAFALPDWEAQFKRLPDPPQRLRLLSPFDPVLRDRARAERLFNFTYRFEAFVPPVKRQYGYYVMPILEGDRLIGRIDPKFHREQSWLEIRRVWWESSVRASGTRTQQLEEAVNSLALMIGADGWSLPARR